MCACCTSAFLHRTLIYKILTTRVGDSRSWSERVRGRRHEACGRSNNSANFLLIATKRQISRNNFAFAANKVAGEASAISIGIVIIIMIRNMIIVNVMSATTRCGPLCLQHTCKLAALNDNCVSTECGSSSSSRRNRRVDSRRERESERERGQRERDEERQRGTCRGGQ